LTTEEVEKFRAEGTVEVMGHKITLDDVSIVRGFAGDSKLYEASEWSPTAEALVILNVSIDEEMERSGLAREIVNRVQKLRKESGLNLGDPVETFYATKDEKLNKVTLMKGEYLKENLLLPLISSEYMSKSAMVVKHSVARIGNSDYDIWITNKTFALDTKGLSVEGAKENEKVMEVVSRVLSVRSYEGVKREMESNNGVLVLKVEGVEVRLELGKNVFLTAGDLFSFLQKERK